ncbi:MAG: DUF2851 family protein [Flavobacterium sp.]|nr:DUF2851 family protein [Flavobacterium sp.]OJV70063.1 MAG: hypothetical protein BGO42_11205 [Flavobacterium sp. 40-81]
MFYTPCRKFFLHHIWQYKKFAISELKTEEGTALQILHSGQYLQHEGPDFFNAQIIIDNQKWVGNVEIHIRSSDWYLHRHETNEQYDNVILHVVWEHDMEVFRKDNTEIPVLVLKKYVPETLLSGYYDLIADKSWIYCEKQLKEVNQIVLLKWKERLFFERLEKKILPIAQLLKENKNDWETTLFCAIARNFGLNVNGEAFFQIAKSIPFTVIRKEQYEYENLEALFLGRGGLLTVPKEDSYYKQLKKRWLYLQDKYPLPRRFVQPLQFYKLRPGNFPTIRLVQLAQLYYEQANLFDVVIKGDTIKTFYKMFNLKVSGYWQTHYLFDKESAMKPKRISKSFIDLVFINTILPLQFLYAQHSGQDIVEKLMDVLREIPPEKNTVIEKFRHFGIMAENAFDSQALLHLKKEYCDAKRCLNCEIGQQLLL